MKIRKRKTRGPRLDPPSQVFRSEPERHGYDQHLEFEPLDDPHEHLEGPKRWYLGAARAPVVPLTERRWTRQAAEPPPIIPSSATDPEEAA